MENSSDWLLQLLQHYKIEKQRSPQFISDWDAIHPLAKYPHDLIKEALTLQTKDTLKYLFADEVSDLKELILKCIDLSLPHITKSNMAITLSGTASIFLSLTVLYKKGARNFLLFTPTYYTIADTINDLGANVFYYNLQDCKNFCADINEIQRLVELHKIDVIVFSEGEIFFYHKPVPVRNIFLLTFLIDHSFLLQ
jgi:aspartate/methionine/tyrosine aminotransferase